MKILFSAFALLIIPLQSSQLSLRTAVQPLYLHRSDEDSNIRITEVPFVNSYADPEWRFSAIAQPFIPSSHSGWNTPGDVNLVSLYKIKISGTYSDQNDVKVVIDASDAKVPKTYPFTIDQVIDSAKTCIKLMYPEKPKNEGQLIIEIIPKRENSSEE